MEEFLEHNNNNIIMAANSQEQLANKFNYTIQCWCVTFKRNRTKKERNKTVYLNWFYSIFSTIIIHHLHPLSPLPSLLPSTVAPNVSLPATTTAVQGQQLLLNCQPTGNPTPSITWNKDNVEIRSGGRVTIGNNGTLVISNVLSSDEGSYSCQGRSNIGSDTASTVVTVLGQ